MSNLSQTKKCFILLYSCCCSMGYVSMRMECCMPCCCNLPFTSYAGVGLIGCHGRGMIERCSRKPNLWI